MTRRGGLFGLLLALLSLHAWAGDAAPSPITVFAAASLTNVLQSLGDEYSRATGVSVRFSFGGSATLARQIDAGAPADLFVAADTQWMDFLARNGRIQSSTRRDLLGNRLVLIAPVASDVRLAIEPGFPLAQALGNGRLATGDPDSVPVGRYARRALQQLGVWNAVSERIVRTEDVRQALLFVARGEAPLGIVYATDARIEPRVRVVDTFPADSHPAITYPMALTATAGPAAKQFADFLASAKAMDAFERAGFRPLRAN